MNRGPGIDPHAPTFADRERVEPSAWTAPADEQKPIDPRADTIPSDASRSAPEGAADSGDGLIGRALGHFRVDALIGRGGMGSVYRAWDLSLLRPVALKVLLADSAAARTRFLREARSQAQLRHPNVVPIHHVGEAEGVVFLVMDLVEGESLADVIRREGRLATERSLDIVDAVASALSAGQKAGLIHRDVKPSNILLEKSGRALLADFGLAKDVAAIDTVTEPEMAPQSSRNTALTRAGSIVGTPAYLAPEQAAGGVVDHRADMYALGASLFETLTGAPPFDAPTPTGIVEQQKFQRARSPTASGIDLHPLVERLVLRLLEKEPSARFDTYDDLRTAIARARATELVTAPLLSRAIAFAIDYLLFFAVGGLVFVGISATGLRARPLAWAVAIGLASLVEWRLRGVSIGKHLMHLRTADRFGLPPSFGVVLTRTLLKASGPGLFWLEMAILPPPVSQVVAAVTAIAWVSALALAFGSRRLSFHDRVTRTQVVFGTSSPDPKTKRFF